MCMDVFRIITEIPAEDCIFKLALSRATGNQLRTALEIMRGRNGKDKSRIKACERELKRREEQGWRD